jgi:hypothetical protein
MSGMGAAHGIDRVALVASAPGLRSCWVCLRAVGPAEMVWGAVSLVLAGVVWATAVAVTAVAARGGGIASTARC